MKEEQFDPNSVGAANGKIFGFPYERGEAEIYLLPVPWEATVSYGSGTAGGPKAILNASAQLDFYDGDVANAWEAKIFMEKISQRWAKRSQSLRPKVMQCIEALEKGKKADKKAQAEVNNASAELNEWVYEKTLGVLQEGKQVGVIGGEHSVPFGFLEALAQVHDKFGILQIDAHADLRKAYEGFEFSHASIMYNALRIQEVHKLVQVSVRDISPGEVAFIERAQGKIKTFYDWDIKAAQYAGRGWAAQCEEMVAALPEKVYVSFDIDGLAPYLCPNTGTPVPGGLQFEEAAFLIKKVVESGRKIIGFDLCEVAPGGQDEWDANVGARVLYKLCGLMWKR